MEETVSKPKIIIRETFEAASSTVGKVEESVSKVMKDRVNATGKGDKYIWGIYLMLLIVAAVELFSASSMEVSGDNVFGPLIRHGRFLIIGFAIVWLHFRARYKFFYDLAWPMGLISIALLVYVFFFGANINGAQRAIMIGSYSIQPAEIAKLAVVVLLSKVLSDNQKDHGVTTKGVVLVALIVIVFSALLYRNGFTNTCLLMGVSLCMFIVGGIEWKKLLIVIAVYGFAGIMIHQMKPEDGQVDRSDTRNSRIEKFFAGVSPDDKITDDNRQVVFAKFAQANGGLIGNGPGNSRESARLPLAFSDYIYSIVVEDTGFVGGVLLLMLYMFLIFRAGVIARKCSRAFPAFLIMGCALLIVMQALTHMAIVTGLVPVSGQPLPFISKGGTSVLVMSAAIGIMLSVSRTAVTSGNKKEINAELKELPEEMHTANPTYIDPIKN